jgi:type I restriction enzyme S subunit
MITKPKTVPELRFPRFEGEWKSVRFDDELAESKLGGNYANSETPTKHPLIKMGNLGRGLMNLRKIEFIEDGETIDPKDRMKEGDLFFNTRNTLDLVGKVAIWRSELPEAYYNSNLMRITFACNHFMNYRLNSFSGVKALRRLATGTTSVAAIYTRDLLRMKMTLPSLPEQRKIADFLTAVDGRIGQLSQKKALLEDYKKGVMQQLFTQAIRFKDDHGNDFPEWEEKKYSEIYTFQNTNSYSRDLLTYEGGEVRNIHYGDIHTKFRSNFYLSQEVVPFIKPEVELKRISKDCYCRVGDLVIADASEDYADVGKCIEIMELGEKTLAGLHTFIARPKKGTMSPGFSGYLMQSREVRLKIMTIAQGTKVLGLSKNMLCNIKLPIPHPAEQTKIANFLTALDRKIESVSTQITGMQTWKKGLLRQMFV